MGSIQYLNNKSYIFLFIKINAEKFETEIFMYV